MDFEFTLPPPLKSQSVSERTAVQVSEDDQCRSQSEYFLLGSDSHRTSLINVPSFGDIETDAIIPRRGPLLNVPSFSDIETDAVPKSANFSSSGSPYSLCEDDLDHDGDVQESVIHVSSPTKHSLPTASSSSSSSSSSLSASISSLRKDLSSLLSFPENRHQAALESISSFQESVPVSESMLFADPGFGNHSSQLDMTSDFIRNHGSQNGVHVTSDFTPSGCCSSQRGYSRTDSFRQRPSYETQPERTLQEQDRLVKSPAFSVSPKRVPSPVDENVADSISKPEPMDTTERYPDKTLEKNPLLTDSAQAVLGMGFLPKQVKQAVDIVLKTKTWNTMNVEDILDAITELTEEESDSSKTQNEVSGADNIRDPEELKESNETLREQTICKMCCTERVSIVFLPCGHLVSCGQCSPALRKCPMCRQVIKGTVRVKFN